MPTLPGLDPLDVCTTFGFCHRIMNRIRLSDRFRLYVGAILSHFSDKKGLISRLRYDESHFNRSAMVGVEDIHRLRRYHHQI